MVRSRISREKRTVSAMVEIYCRGNHRTGTICEDCEELLAYAMKKLDKCRFSESKPACSKCTVHCYGSEMRDRMRAVMRYSGPRMAYRHPIMTVQHSIDGRRRPSTKVEREAESSR